MTADAKSVPVTRAAGEKPESAMVPAEPGWEPFLSLRREIDKLFDDMTWRPSRLLEKRPWTRMPALPAADIVEKDGDFVMTLDVPGTLASWTCFDLRQCELPRRSRRSEQALAGSPRMCRP